MQLTRRLCKISSLLRCATTDELPDWVYDRKEDTSLPLLSDEAPESFWLTSRVKAPGTAHMNPPSPDAGVFIPPPSLTKCEEKRRGH